MALSQQTPPCPGGTFAYCIRPGDTFTRLARRFGTTVISIQALNPNLDPNNLQIGQIICIPRENGVPLPLPEPEQRRRRCPLGTQAYTVKAGDDLYSIAQSHRTTVSDIISVNPGLSPDLIEVGQVICVPVEPA